MKDKSLSYLVFLISHFPTFYPPGTMLSMTMLCHLDCVCHHFPHLIMLCHLECFVSSEFLPMAGLVVAHRDTAGPCTSSSPSPTYAGRSGNVPRGKYI